MLGDIDRFLAAQSAARMGWIVLLIVALVGGIDVSTGYELSFSIFYLVPVFLGAWYRDWRFGIFVCILCAATWMAADQMGGHPYRHAFIPFWNTTVRFGFFFVVAFLLQRLRRSLALQESLAQVDGLTGLLNARTFRQRCTALLLLAGRQGRPVSLGYIDLDDFKVVNDTLGHDVGDQVLKAVASCLVGRLRGSDVAGRLGGDEFAVLLPETGLDGARTFFRDLHETLIELARGRHWPVGFSVGVAIFPAYAGDPDEAVGIADSLMYRVKKSGKNAILFEAFDRTSPGV